MQRAIGETLQQRGTPHDESSFKRIEALVDDEDMQKRWKFFLKTIKDDTLEFSIVIEAIYVFLEPVFEAVVNKGVWQKHWKVNMEWTIDEMKEENI